MSPLLLAAMSLPVIALLGREDKPTDALEEYCRYLSEALCRHEIQLEIRRVPWEVRGWSKALQELERTASQWQNSWVLLQYTALAWSARGFPQRVLRIIRILKSAGARVGIVFHDVEPNHGQRLIDSVRRYVQVRTMRRALTLVDLTIFTVAPEKLSWLGVVPPKSAFIPVGPNLPISAECLAIRKPNDVPTIGVFSITGGDPGVRETRTILDAVRYASRKIGKLRLLVFGRHAELRETTLRQGLHDLPVELSVEGVVDSAEVVRRLCSSDVLLFVRGNISSRRGSAIAGIACGLPVIAFSGSETAAPATDAGVVLIPPDQTDQLNISLVRVLSDSAFREELANRSRRAYQQHFSWDAIGDRYAALLHSVPRQ
jgi:glycosyltransferase involved in cell wall biosynthesis